MYMYVPGELHISKDCVYVVVKNVQEVGGELEGGAEHDHHIGKSHLVHCRLQGGGGGGGGGGGQKYIV